VDRSSFESRFKSLLKKRGYRSLSSFALKHGFVDQTISNWVRGKTDPSLSEFLRLCVILDEDPRKLWYSEEEYAEIRANPIRAVSKEPTPSEQRKGRRAQVG
jgi:transcriptional regulator with XRE-family HTH domain